MYQRRGNDNFFIGGGNREGGSDCLAEGQAEDGERGG